MNPLPLQKAEKYGQSEGVWGEEKVIYTCFKTHPNCLKSTDKLTCALKTQMFF